MLKEAINKVTGNCPADLLEFYENKKQLSCPELGIDILNSQSAIEVNDDDLGIPVFERLGLWQLNKTNTSNPFCYISKGVCAGMVMQYYHDEGSFIAFSSLNEFYKAIEEAIKTDIYIDYIEPVSPIKNKATEEIENLCDEDLDEAVFLIALYLTVCDEIPQRTKSKLVAHPDFFVKEEFALWLLKHPKAEDLAMAEQLSKDEINQVAELGKKAQSAINKVKWVNK